ncbi:MAG: hypothetical protein LBM99_04850, partial [Bacillales bacterium]|nr:hypothetical protein [Bacillales bacterium]
MDSRLSKLRGLGCEVCEKGEMVVVSRKDYNLELTLCVPIEVHREEMVFNDSIQTLSAGLKILENPKYLRS